MKPLYVRVEYWVQLKTSRGWRTFRETTEERWEEACKLATLETVQKARAIKRTTTEELLTNTKRKERE